MKKENYDSREHYNDAKRYQSSPGNKPQSLAEQLAEFNKSPEQKRREQPRHEWFKDLYHYLNTSREITCSISLFNFVSSKYRDDFDKFHTTGAKFSEIIKFVNNKADELREI